MRTVYRRVLLIAPWRQGTDGQQILMLPPYVNTTVNLPVGPSTTVPLVLQDRAYYRMCDVSFRREGDLRIPNTLADLTKRENRFAHHINGPTTYPHAILQTAIFPNAATPAFPTGSLSPLHPFGLPFETLLATDPDRTGEDVMLNNVLAFDLRVFDPGAPLYDVAGTVTEPSDFGWPIGGGTVVGYGSYVDLGWRPNYTWTVAEPDALFYLAHQVGWHPSAPTLLTGHPSVYDTGSFHYENDNIDQGGFSTVPDEFTNDLDDDNINGTDDVGEREAPPPYDAPLRGIQVKLRIYEPDARLIREATVTRNFVPN